MLSSVAGLPEGIIVVFKAWLRRSSASDCLRFSVPFPVGGFICCSGTEPVPGDCVAARTRSWISRRIKAWRPQRFAGGQGSAIPVGRTPNGEGGRDTLGRTCDSWLTPLARSLRRGICGRLTIVTRASSVKSELTGSALASRGGGFSFPAAGLPRGADPSPSSSCAPSVAVLGPAPSAHDSWTQARPPRPR